MSKRINRVIELLVQKQPIYYTGAHSGQKFSYEKGSEDASTWADYINAGMEHGPLDMRGLEDYMHGMMDAGPINSGHLTPAVIVEAPVEGSSEDIIRYNAWQFRQILARGVHGILLCKAETPDAVRTFVESCRYPINHDGLGKGLGEGTRGVGSEAWAARVWGVSSEEYIQKADPWPLNKDGELFLGLKLESVRAISNVEQTLSVPGIAFAEWGPSDLHMSFGLKRDLEAPLHPLLVEARARVFEACKQNKIAFLEGASPEDVKTKIDEGIMILAGGNEETARVGRSYTGRTMPV